MAGVGVGPLRAVHRRVWPKRATLYVHVCANYTPGRRLSTCFWLTTPAFHARAGVIVNHNSSLPSGVFPSFFFFFFFFFFLDEPFFCSFCFELLVLV